MRCHAVELSLLHIFYKTLKLNLLKVSTMLEMESLWSEAVENNAEASNVPRIGVDNNTDHPVTQANLAPAVSHMECDHF